jgi:hypothetical protein
MTTEDSNKCMLLCSTLLGAALRTLSTKMQKRKENNKRQITYGDTMNLFREQFVDPDLIETAMKRLESIKMLNCFEGYTNEF